MIYDTLEHIEQYTALDEGLAKGLRFLAQTDFSALPDGRHEIDGDRVFANVSSYTTQPQNLTPESHRAYIDIQHMITGTELVGIAPLACMEEVCEEHPERDLWLHHGPVEQLTIGAGRFVAVWPQDAHAPGVASQAPAQVRKCVVKVRVHA